MSVAVVSGEIYFIPAQLKSELLEFLVDKQTRFDSNGEPNLKAVSNFSSDMHVCMCGPYIVSKTMGEGGR